MKRKHSRWTSLIIIMTLLASLLPSLSIHAAASRITINNLYKTTNASTGLPQVDSSVQRFTSSPVSITATIENITDAQIPDIYYEITNINTGVTTQFKSNKALKTSTFDIVFNNVDLTEGLNKITIKLGDSSSIASAPGWAYFTPVTNISDLAVDGQPFSESKMYPESPSKSSMINVTGTVPNASYVQVYLLGDAQPKSAFLNNNQFYFNADDINKTTSTANFRLKPGDNQMTVVSGNNTKSYSVTKNLIYDNGKPFAFNAMIKDNATGSSYKRLIETPTVTTPNVNISAYLKNDLTTLGDVQYRYVDVSVGGQKFGPYDMSGAIAATTVNGVYPNIINEGYSPMQVALVGSGLNDNTLTIKIEDKNGADVTGSTPLAYAGVSSTDKTVGLFNLPSGLLTAANSPYKFTVMKGTSELNSFSVQVANSVSNVVDVAATNANFTAAKVVENGGPYNINVAFTAAAPVGARVDITDLSGQNVFATPLVGTPSGNNVSIKLENGLRQGVYKYRVILSGKTLTEQSFTVGRALPDAPTVNSSSTPLSIVKSGSTTYLSVSGTHLGIVPGDITNIKLVDAAGVAANITNVSVAEAQNAAILFKLDPTGTNALVPGTTYNLTFEKAKRYDNGDAYAAGGSDSLTVNNAIRAVAATAAYANEAVQTITPAQIKSGVTSTIAIAGSNLGTTAVTGIEILKETGLPVASGSAVVTDVTPTQITATISGLLEGSYLLKVNSNNNIISYLPFTVVNPSVSNITPVFQNNPIQPTDDPNITISGTNFGRDESKLKLHFDSDSNPSQSLPELTPVAGSLIGGSQVKFAKPSLPEGSYSIKLMYDGVAVSTAVKYTVITPATIKEVASWYKPNRYKVFEFSTDVTIPSDRYQVVQFKFYNNPSDNVPPSEFTFKYENPNLPFVDNIKREIDGEEILLSEYAQTEINELPAKLNIYTNDKAQKVNVYYGDYSSTSTPNQTVKVGDAGVVTSTGGIGKFPIVLDNLPDGITKITVVPSSTAAGTAKSGENLSGLKTYSLKISSTPYVIVNNIYSGLVVKDQINEIKCTVGLSEVGGCISGRLVNVPQSEYSNVEVYLNGDRANLQKTPISDFDDLTKGTFHFRIYDKFGKNLSEGKNTIKFVINRNGVKVTEASYDIFVFSTDRPEFLSIKPIETTDIPKYTATSQPLTYSTQETAVAFSGQFANATEIKLTVRSKDSDGKTVVRYDRRHTNFTQQDPINGNPYFFAGTPNTPAGMFTTNSINLSKTGDTIFEFMITNASGVTVVQTITVVREPLPYKIIYPVLTKNSKKEDQANINSNYLEIQMEAENADKVVFGKDEAVVREVIDSYGNKVKRYYYEVNGLKAGRNVIKFTVTSGTQKINGSFILFNADTPVEGAQYKGVLTNKYKLFDGELELTFPKGTNLMRNDATAVNQYLTADRKLLFGIANTEDGRIDKYKHPAATDGQIDNPNPLVSSVSKLLLTEPTGRFKPVSQLFWIDAGTISKGETDLNQALSGSGRLPHDDETFYNRNLSDLVVPTERGTLKLKYDPVIREGAWRYLTVYHYDIYEDYRGVTQARWRNIGGVVDTKSNTITVPVERFGFYQVMYMDKSFDDVIGHPWARNDLDTLYSKGIMLNKENSAFVPSDPISRGEFATMLVKIFDLPIRYTETPTFSDVLRVNPLTNGLYDYKYIESAARAGIIRGAGGGRFSPDSPITRQDAAVMIARAANMKLGTDDAKVLASLQKSFTDAAGIDLYSRPSVEAVTKAKLIEGKENTLLQGQTKLTYRFDPTENFTRAEAAKVAIRVLQQQKKIPK